MNKRIRELAEQCYNLPDIPEALYYRKFDKEKFAELIVRECSDLFDIEWGLCELTGHDASKVILKHFGVK